MTENEIRETICFWGKSLFDRGMSPGSSGNISVKIEDGYLFTPTNSCLGNLNPDELSKLDLNGDHLSGLKPTKELPLHFACYKGQESINAIVHLHSTYSVALSCVRHNDHENILPVYTPYFTMRLKKLALVPYFPPGDQALGDAVYEKALHHRAVLLANHGPVVMGESLEKAVYNMEELEENAKLFFMLKNIDANELSEADKVELHKRYSS